MSGSVLVVGAAGGVGTSVVKQLMDKGYDVIGTVLNSKEEESVRTTAPAIGDILEMDLSDAASARSTLSHYLGNMSGDLHGVIVCAAISPYGPMETASLALARRTLEINTLSGIAVYQAVMPSLRKTRGRIVFISSMAGRSGMPFIGFYVASKFALEGAVEVMRYEAAEWGIHISLIEPGGIQTGMVTGQLESLERDIAALDEQERSLYGKLYRQFQALAGQAYKTALKPEDVARVTLRAYEAARPRARYPVGKDSRAICSMARLLPRSWMEAVFRKMYTQALKE